MPPECNLYAAHLVSIGDIWEEMERLKSIRGIRWGLAWIAALLLLGVLSPRAEALSCVSVPNVEEAYTKYDRIVVAKVESVRRVSPFSGENKVKLAVERSFKGKVESQLTIREDFTWGALNGPSEQGERYLFFLNHKDGQWHNPLCAPSAPVAEASDMLAYLEDYEAPVTEARATDWGSWALYGGIVALVLFLLGATVVIRRKQQ